MTTHGVVTFGADPDSGVIVTPQWCDDLRALGVQDVSVSLRADAHNHLPLDLFHQAFSVLHSAGLRLHVKLDIDFNRPWLEGNPNRLFYANMALGYHGNRRHNQWIVDSCYRARAAAQALSPLVTSWTMFNEPNLALDGTTRPVHIGENVPPVAGDKAPALAPEVFYSLCYELDGWLRVGGAKVIRVGPLSWLPIGSAGDIGWHGNVYGAAYMRAGLDYLHRTGVHVFPWQAFTTNSESAWTLDKATAMKRAIDTVQAAYGLSLPLVISEWGMRGTPNPVQVAQTVQALSAVSNELYWFQHPFRPDGWGLSRWVVAGAGFVPALPRTQWWEVVRGLVAPVPVT